jgi:hypothetical protein
MGQRRHPDRPGQPDGLAEPTPHMDNSDDKPDGRSVHVTDQADRHRGDRLKVLHEMSGLRTKGGGCSGSWLAPNYAGVNSSPSKTSRSRALALSGCRDEYRKKRTRPIFLSTRVGFNSEMDRGERRATRAYLCRSVHFPCGRAGPRCYQHAQAAESCARHAPSLAQEHRTAVRATCRCLHPGLTG